MSDIATHYDPLDESLWGEYARLLLVGTTACSAAAWTIRLPTDPESIVIVVANLLVIAAVINRRFAGLLRLATWSILAITIITMMVANPGSGVLWSQPAIFSPFVTLAALLVLTLRDGMIVIKTHSGAVDPRKVFLILAVLAIGIYMVLIPAVDAYLE